jgi:hypothetical protein
VIFADLKVLSDIDDLADLTEISIEIATTDSGMRSNAE